ncbi:unnamed protein product, partial [Linum tenue]
HHSSFSFFPCFFFSPVFRFQSRQTPSSPTIPSDGNERQPVRLRIRRRAGVGAERVDRRLQDLLVTGMLRFRYPRRLRSGGGRRRRRHLPLRRS